MLQTLKQVSGRNKPVPETVIDDHKAVIYFQTDEIFIRNLSDAPLHIDGDPAETPATAEYKRSASIASSLPTIIIPEIWIVILLHRL